MQIDELENRLSEIKLELFNNYKKTIKKLSDIQNEEEYNDHDYIENIESQDTDGEIKYITKVMYKINSIKYLNILYLNIIYI